MIDLSRRQALHAVIAALAAAPFARAFAAATDPAPALDAKRLVPFMERITGLPLADETFAQWMLDNLDAAARDRLAAAAAQAQIWSDERFAQEIQPAGALGDLADAVLRLCFTGKGKTGGETVYVDYLQALAWRAAGIKPGTQCDPAGFGGWAKPPEPL